MITYRLHGRWIALFIVHFLAVALLALASTKPLLAQTPFTCSMLSLSNKRLFGNQFRIDIHNDNVDPAVISRVQMTWPNIPFFAQMGLAQMTLNTVIMWNGPDPQVTSSATTTTDTNTKPGNPPFLSTLPSARTLPGQSASIYAATFNGPPLLMTYVTYYQYAVTFTIDNPLTPNSPCVLTSAISNPIPTPTPTGQPTPTFTPTPDCGANLISIRFNSFDVFGIVRFDILSQRNTTSTLQGFTINWQKYVNSQRLRKVSLLAPPGQPGSVLVWDAVTVSEDTTPPTTSSTEGTWLTDFTIPPSALGTPSGTPIFFDFDGINRYDDYYASRNPPYGGSSDFNFSSFKFRCGDTDGGTVGEVTPEVLPTGTLITPTSAPSAMPPRNFYTSLPVTLTWNAVSWATGYKIEYTDLDFDSIQSVVKILPADSLSYSVDMLANGTYYWRVMALGGTVDKWSNIESFVLSAPPSPTSPAAGAG